MKIIVSILLCIGELFLLMFLFNSCYYGEPLWIKMSCVALTIVTGAIDVVLFSGIKSL